MSYKFCCTKSQRGCFRRRDNFRIDTVGLQFPTIAIAFVYSIACSLIPPAWTVERYFPHRDEDGLADVFALGTVSAADPAFKVASSIDRVPDERLAGFFVFGFYISI